MKKEDEMTEKKRRQKDKRKAKLKKKSTNNYNPKLHGNVQHLCIE